MTSLRHALSATAIVTALTGAFVGTFAGPIAAQAQPPAAGTPPAASGHRHDSGHGHGSGHAHGMKEGEHGQARLDRHMNELKAHLQLTAAQEGAWTQFVSAMRPTPMAHGPNHDAMMKLPTPERIDQMRAMRQQHMLQMDQRAEATKAFYAALTPEQKKRFDERTARMMERHGPSRQGHHGQHG